MGDSAPGRARPDIRLREPIAFILRFAGKPISLAEPRKSQPFSFGKPGKSESNKSESGKPQSGKSQPIAVTEPGKPERISITESREPIAKRLSKPG